MPDTRMLDLVTVFPVIRILFLFVTFSDGTTMGTNIAALGGWGRFRDALRKAQNDGLTINHAHITVNGITFGEKRPIRINVDPKTVERADGLLKLRKMARKLIEINERAQEVVKSFS